MLHVISIINSLGQLFNQANLELKYEESGLRSKNYSSSDPGAVFAMVPSHR